MRKASLFVLLVLVGSAPSCSALLREHVTPFPPGTPVRAPWELNRELLMPGPGRIVFIVDVVSGHAPETEALDDLVALASRYGERPALWTRQRPAHLRDEDSYVFIRYGATHEYFGQAWPATIERKRVYVIAINQERHRRFRSERLHERRLEEQTLIHEYGHLLGLPTADHGYYPHYPDWSDGAHCVNPTCALSKPALRSLLYALVNTGIWGRFLEDYCDECQRAIRDAKAYWRSQPAAERGS